MPENSNWQDKIKKYCEEFNIPLDYLVDTLREPKVIPMIRGKAFEFSVMLKLKEVLSNDIWDVTKVPMNAQQGIHDVDVLVTHRVSNRKIRIECKLSGKGSYTFLDSNNSYVRVKCMRSRTLGASKVASLAPLFGVSEEQLLVHNDQYLPSDFDVVITSLANAFYETDPTTEEFVWNPTPEGKEFLNRLAGGAIPEAELQNYAFQQMYIAKSSDLVISSNTGIVCTRRKCETKDSCGFIPNYPVIKFENGAVNNNWSPIVNAEEFFASLV